MPSDSNKFPYRFFYVQENTDCRLGFWQPLWFAVNILTKRTVMVSTQDNYWTGSSPVLCTIFFLTVCLKINTSLRVQGEKKKSLSFKKLASSIGLPREVCYIPWWRERYLRPVVLQLKHEWPGLKLGRHPWPQKRTQSREALARPASYPLCWNGAHSTGSISQGRGTLFVY